MTWRYHTPERDGHAPDDWVEGCDTEYELGDSWNKTTCTAWAYGLIYRYRPLQDATVEPSFDTLKDQCLALPQDQREALIEAMQKPQRDWADGLAEALWHLDTGSWREKAAEVLRFGYRLKTEEET